MLITLTQLKKSLQALKDFLLAKITVKDVQINGTSVLDEGVANVPVANATTLGAVKVGSNWGVRLTNNEIVINPASSGEIKSGNNGYKPITPNRQNEATFYGLASASGDTTQSASSNPVGTYTDEAKTSIKSMLGVEDPIDVQINGTSILNDGIANVPVAKAREHGVVKVNDLYGVGVFSDGTLRVTPATIDAIKTAMSIKTPITPDHQHEATFYGLAKAAGDTTQSASSNAVGTYTDEAKAAIKTMLGIDTITVDSIPTTEIDTLFA